MNRLVLFVGFIAIIGLLLSCSCEDCNSKLYTTSATIFLINETSEVVKSEPAFNCVILPGDTVVHKESYTSPYSEKPSIENYQPFPTAYLFIYGDTLKRESGVRFREHYEVRKQVAPLVFEFTFIFTEEKKAKAHSCYFPR